MIGEPVAHIRWLLARDMPEVLRIETVSFDHPWVKDDFSRCLRSRNTVGMVAEMHERIVGYMIYELHSRGLVCLNLAVHPDYRRRGIGRAMLDKLIGKLSAQRRSRLVVDVGERNLDAHRWLRACGLPAVAVVAGGFDGEDAYRFVYRLGKRQEAEPCGV